MIVGLFPDLLSTAPQSGFDRETDRDKTVNPTAFSIIYMGSIPAQRLTEIFSTCSPK